MEPKSAAVSTVRVSVRKDSPFRISISFCSSASSSACLLLDTSLIMSQLDSSSESLSQELSDRSVIVVKVTFHKVNLSSLRHGPVRMTLLHFCEVQ